MSSERYYMLVNPSGDICLVYRITGALPTAPFPIQMRDEWGRFLPYSEQGDHNYGCVPEYLTHASEILAPIRLSSEQFAEIGHVAFYYYQYQHKGRKIQLRPGHQKVQVSAGIWGDPNKEYHHIGVNWPEDLELCGMAYGGRPIYWIKWDSAKSHTDFPELEKQGCLHPLKYKPRNFIPVDFHPQRYQPTWLTTAMKKLPAVNLSK